MDGFEEYRWQDHVVRPGWWKLDMLLAAVSIGAFALTFDTGVGGDREIAAREAAQSAHCRADAPAEGATRPASPRVVGLGQPCEGEALVRRSNPEPGGKGLAGPSS